MQKGFIEIVRLLMSDNRINVNKEDQYEYIPFHIACSIGFVEVGRVINE